MKIGFASTDWAMTYLGPHGHPTPGGSGWYRCALPAAGLASGGHTVVYGRLVRKPGSDEFGILDWTDTGHGGFDVIVMQRWMQRTVAEDIGRARATGQILVNDVDDWFFGLDPRNRAWASTNPKYSPDSNTDHYRTILAASSAITCSTPYLAERLRKEIPGVPVHPIRNAIDIARWARQGVREDEPLVVGWVGATQWRSGDLETLQGVLGPFLQRHDATFLHAGHQEGAAVAAELAGVPPERARTRGMAPIEEYPNLFAGIDIGLVPLSTQPFNFAKSAIKGMEYTAAGIPFVATKTPEYSWLGATTARRSKDWIRELERLADPDERRASRVALLEKVAANDINHRWRDWEAVYADLAPASSPEPEHAATV